MEIDPLAAQRAEDSADRVVVGNVDSPGLWDLVDDESFDVVTFGDVLEHLRDPLAVLRMAVAKLKPTGFIVTSLPNVAHGDVRLSLLRGSFEYRDTGLLTGPTCGSSRCSPSASCCGRRGWSWSTPGVSSCPCSTPSSVSGGRTTPRPSCRRSRPTPTSTPTSS